MIQKNNREKYKPYGDLGVSIITASYNCFQDIKLFINAQNDEEKQQLEVYLFYEFIYFFLHMTNRMAFSKLSSQQIEEMHEVIGPTIVETAIHTFFKHWPEEYKSKMFSEIYEKINITELEYSKSKEIFSKEKPYTSDSLFSMLARNVSELINDSMNPVTMAEVLQVSMKEFTNMKLSELIQDISYL